MKFYHISVKGRREYNEDSSIAKKIGDHYLFAVADGLGGHAAGEIASRIALIELEETVKRVEGSPEELLRRSIEKANEEVYSQSKEFADRRGMGTTLVASLFDASGKGVIANVGDSRAYLINDGVWHTKDQSFVQALIDAGVIDEDKRFGHPMRNIVTKTIGADEQIEPDIYDIDINDKILLLSSDGLHDYVTDERIREIAKDGYLKDVCDKLIDEALESGSTDNITLVICRVV